MPYEAGDGSAGARSTRGVGREEALAFLAAIIAKYPDVPPPTSSELGDARTVFLDVRTEAEHAVSTIPGAVRELPENLPNDTHVVHILRCECTEYLRALKQRRGGSVDDILFYR